MARAERSRALEAEKRAAAAEAYLQVTRTGDLGGERGFSRSFSRILFVLKKKSVWVELNLVGVALSFLSFFVC